MSLEELVKLYYTQWSEGNSEDKVKLSLVVIALCPHYFNAKLLDVNDDVLKMIMESTMFEKANFGLHIVECFRNTQKEGQTIKNLIREG